MARSGAKASGKAWAALSAENLIAKRKQENQVLKEELNSMRGGKQATRGPREQAQQHAISARDQLLPHFPSLHGPAAANLSTALRVSAVRTLPGEHELRGRTLSKRAEYISLAEDAGRHLSPILWGKQ